MPTMAKQHRFFRALAMVSVIVLFGTLFWKITRDVRYAHYWPKSPQPEIGRIIPHGVPRHVTVFISREDDRYDIMIEMITLCSVVLGFVFSVLGGEYKRTER
jgi:hypothetical protein